MKKFLEDLVRWWDDPITTAVFAAIGTAVILGGIDRANRSVDDAHERIDQLDAIVYSLPVRRAAGTPC
jgi:hypothetical protein